MNRFTCAAVCAATSPLAGDGIAERPGDALAGRTIRPMRVMFIAAECEPWAKTGGLGDVVDALARALGHLPGTLDEPVEVFLPRYRSVPVPQDRPLTMLRLAVPDATAPGGAVEVAIRTFEASGYRLRLVDQPALFDRDGLYGDTLGEFPDNARRFAVLARAALETRRSEARPVDVISVHDWHACPAAILRDLVYAGDPFVGSAAITLTLHNLAYHGWTQRGHVAQLGLGMDPRIGDGWGVDLLREGIRRADAVNTVSPRLRPRSAPSRGRDGPRRRPAGPRIQLRRDPQRPGPGAVGPGHRRRASPRRTTSRISRGRPPAAPTSAPGSASTPRTRPRSSA